MLSYLDLLRGRPQFRYLWFAAVISFAGDWFNTIASLILVSRYTDSNTAVGALFLARSLPPFLLGPAAGVIADRFSRRNVLISTDLLRFFIVLGFLLVDGREDAWLIYVLSIAQFSVSAFFEPARTAILPSLVTGSRELLLANTLSSITWSAMLALGAALGGLVASIFGVATAITIDAASFLVSALFIYRIAAVPRVEVSVEGRTGWQDLVDGLAYVRHHPRTGIIASVKGLTQIGSPDIMIAVYAATIFRLGDDGALALGWLYAAAGLGAVLGPLLSNLFAASSTKGLQNAIGVSFVVVSVGWIIFGWAPSLTVALLAMLLRHMGGSINWTYSTVLLQMRVPDRFMGRVFALDLALFTLAISLSVWLSGLILDNLGLNPRQLSFLLGVGSLAPLLPWMWLSRSDPQRRQLAAEQAAD